MGKVAACSNDRLSGFFTTNFCNAISLGANAPEAFSDTAPITVSPGLKRETFDPTASTVPAKSMPMALGNFEPVIIFICPLRIFQSTGLIEAAATRTTTSSAPGGGNVKEV